MKELLFSITKDDFKIDRFRSGGKGGQHQNTRDTGVRITHIESGAVGESRNHRSQHQNQKEAFKRCIETDTFKSWHKLKTQEELAKLNNKKVLTPSEIMNLVEEQIKEENLIIETY